MKRMVSIVVGSAALMCGAARVETTTFEEIASDAQVVTAVDLGGLASEAAIPTKASQVGVTLDKGVITIDGEAITPLVEHQSLEAYATKAAVADAADAGTNYVDAATNAVMTSVDGKGYLTSESDPAWRTWTNKMSVALGRNATLKLLNAKSSSTAVGHSSTAAMSSSTAVGHSSTAGGFNSTAVGRQSRAYAPNSVAIGYGAVASNTYAVAIGDGTPSEPYTYEYETIINEDGEEEVITNSSATVIGSAFAAGIHSTALGYMAYAPAYSLGLAYTPETILLCSSNTTEGAGSTARSLQSYLDEKADKNEIPDVSKFITAEAISASNAVFSNAVLGVDGVAKKYTNGGALGVPKDAAIFTADVADGASLVVDNLPTDDAYVTDFVVLVNAAADTQLGKITTTETVLFAGGNLYETGSIAAGYSLITFTHTDGYWVASLTALEAATTTQE